MLRLTLAGLAVAVVACSAAAAARGETEFARWHVDVDAGAGAAQVSVAGETAAGPVLPFGARLSFGRAIRARVEAEIELLGVDNPIRAERAHSVLLLAGAAIHVAGVQLGAGVGPAPTLWTGEDPVETYSTGIALGIALGYEVPQTDWSVQVAGRLFGTTDGEFEERYLAASAVRSWDF